MRLEPGKPSDEWPNLSSLGEPKLSRRFVVRRLAAIAGAWALLAGLAAIFYFFLRLMVADLDSLVK